jgi:hypothetical protein
MPWPSVVVKQHVLQGQDQLSVEDLDVLLPGSALQDGTPLNVLGSDLAGQVDSSTFPVLSRDGARHPCPAGDVCPAWSIHARHPHHGELAPLHGYLPVSRWPT